MMIRPANFGYNEQTAENNSFQSTEGKGDVSGIREAAIVEFDAMVDQLRINGIQVIVVEDTAEPKKPDAVFPNNWVSLHENGALITYPMYAPNRRIERREDIIPLLEETHEVTKRYSLEHYEEESIFLEGTGSMIFDRANNVVYACLSDRTDATLLDKYCVLMEAGRVVFHSVDRDGEPIYHTNVMMAIGVDFVVICLESVPDEVERKELLAAFEPTGRQVVEISYDQMEQFAGNMLQVSNLAGDTYLVMSQTAYDSLNQSQLEILSSLTNILPIDIPTIEFYGGGSVRCMMAEVFLPKKV